MDAAILKSFTNYIDAHIAQSRLKDNGVDCWLRNENTSTIMPIWNNAIGGIQLVVRPSDLPAARTVLQQIDEERRRHTACPKCESKNVEYINSMRKPINWLSAALSFFAGDMAVMPEQRYHCFQCGNEWKEEEEE